MGSGQQSCPVPDAINLPLVDFLTGGPGAPQWGGDGLTGSASVAIDRVQSGGHAAAA